jgi:zinc protease
MMKRLGILLALVFLGAGGLVPRRGSAQNIQNLPDFSYRRLLNDLQVVVASTPGAGDNMAIGLVLRYGAVYDPVGKGGLANLVCRMFLKSTTDKTQKEIQEEIDYLGASVEIGADWDGIRVLMRGQSSKFERALLLVYQLICEAQFNEEDLAKVKSEILEEMEKPEDPRQRIRTRFESVLFRGTSYGRALRGSKATLQNITIGDVRYFYRRYFSAAAASLVFVGPTPAPLVLQKIGRIWGVWVRQEAIPFTFVPPRPPASRTVFLQDDPASPAAQFLLGNLWPKREDPSYYPGVMAVRLLQERLTKVLPTSLLTAWIEGRRLPGPFCIQGQAAADQAVGEIQKVLDVVQSYVQSPAPAAELAEWQERWINEFHAGLATADGLCRAILDEELYRLGANYVGNFAELVRRYDANAVRNASKELIFPGGVVILVRGPAATLRAGLEALGPLEQLSP